MGYDEPSLSLSDGKLGLSPNGSTNCFSYVYSPDVTVEDGKIYRAWFEMLSSVTDADKAVQFRLRVNQKGAWTSWYRIVNSFNQHAPSSAGSTFFDVILDPAVTGSGDTNAVFSFDIMSFDPSDDINSSLYLDSMSLDEVSMSAP